MQSNEYQLALSSFIKRKKQELEDLKLIQFPEFEQISIYNHHNPEDVIDTLKKSINNTDSVLYYMTVKSDRLKIKETVKGLKKENKGAFLLPKVNESDSYILYVGKCNSEFIKRFRCHLGIGSKRLYALHLSLWNNNPKIEIDPHYSIVHIPDKKQLHLLEVMETILHEKLKPMLGRAGH